MNSWNIIKKWKEDDAPSQVRSENSQIVADLVWNIEILETFIDIRRMDYSSISRKTTARANIRLYGLYCPADQGKSDSAREAKCC